MIFFTKRATDIEPDFSHCKQEITPQNGIKKENIYPCSLLKDLY